jgi:hypothetical protein
MIPSLRSGVNLNNTPVQSVEDKESTMLFGEDMMKQKQSDVQSVEEPDGWDRVDQIPSYRRRGTS